MSIQSAAHEDRDMEGVEAALRRAARRARELGEQTGTPVYVLRDGEIVDLTAGKSASGKHKTGGIRQTIDSARGAWGKGKPLVEIDKEIEARRAEDWPPER